MPDRSQVDVVVVGAGLGGLAAAALAGRAGLRVAVCERAGTAGGRARTQLRAGFALNLGPHALYRDGAAERVLRDLGVETTGGTPPVSGSLALDRGACHALPGGAVSLLTTGLFGLGGKIELARMLARLGQIDTDALAGVPVDAWLARAVRHPDVRRLLHALVRLVSYAHAPDRLSAGFAVAQLRHALRHGVRYLDGGWQTLVDALHARAVAAGVEVRTAAPVVAVEPDGRGVRLRDGGTVAARAVVLALDAAATAPLLADGPTRRWAEDAVPVRAACLDVCLARLPRPSTRFALGIDRPLYCSVHSAVAQLAPAGGALVHVARYLDGSSDEPSATEDELAGVLDAVQPGWREVVVFRRFLPDLVAASALATAAQRGLAGRPAPAVPEQPGVFLAGDWIGPEGWLADATLASAARAAELAIARCRAGGAAAAA